MDYSQSPASNSVTIGSFPLGLALQESTDGYFVVTKMARPLGSLQRGHELIGMNGASLANMSLKDLEKRLAQLRKDRKTVTFTYRTPPDDANGPLFMPFDEPTADPKCCTEQTNAMTESNNLPDRITTIRTSAAMPIHFTHAVNTTDLITPNDLKKTIINIDSRFRDSDQQTSTHFTYRMDPQIKNVIRIKLVSIEFPNVFYTFSPGNTQFSLSVSGTSTPVLIDSGNYTMMTIQAAIQDSLDVAMSVLGITGLAIQIDPASGLVTISADSEFSMDFTASTFGRALGFNKNTYSGEFIYTGESTLNIYGEQYVLFQLNDFNNVEQRMKDKNIVMAFAKIVLKSGKFAVNYDDSSNFLTKEIIFTQPNNLSQLTIIFRDAYGSVINNGGINISFALEVTEVMNCKLYDYYRNYLLAKN